MSFFIKIDLKNDEKLDIIECHHFNDHISSQPEAKGKTGN
tara:strand:- start:342 stop:461 length:120 start_codon:yes stop_codon:yes gene_type:complete